MSEQINELSEVDNSAQKVQNLETKDYESVLFATKGYEELRTLLESVNTLVDEVTFEVDEDGLKIRTMDPSHVALIDVVLPNSMFDVYQVIGSHKFGIRGDEFLKVLKTFNPKELLNVLVKDGELHLIGHEETASLRIIDSTTSNTPLPKLTFNTMIELSPKALKKIEKIEVMSEYVTITSLRPSKISMSGKGDTGSKEVSFESGSDDVNQIEIKEESKATYSLDYLLKITKIVAKNKGSVTFEYSTKMPLRLEQRIGNTGRIHFYLAPRVQD